MPKLVDVDQRRAELADAAAHVIARHGIDGTSMRGVAAEAGWTTGALVHYFSNKQELLAFTLQTSLRRLRSQQADRAHLPPAEALRGMLLDALPTTQAAKLHWIVTLAFAAQASSDVQLATIQRDAYRSFHSAVAELLTHVRPGSDQHDPDPQVLSTAQVEHEAERLIGVVDGIALQALFDPERWTCRRQIDALQAALDHSIGAPEGTQ